MLSDRFTDSSLVYQGYGRELGAAAIEELERIACRGIKPDLTLLVDIDAETSLARARARNQPSRTAKPAWTSNPWSFTARSTRPITSWRRANPERVRMVNGRAGIDAHGARDLERGGRLCLRASGATGTSPTRSNRCWRRTACRRRCSSPARRAWAKPRWRGAWAARLLGHAARIEQDDLSLPHNLETVAGARTLAGRPAQRGSAAVREPSGFRHLRARWPAAPDLHPAVAPDQGERPYLPNQGSRRVFLIDHVDRADEQAANSLLKTLEEPPPHLVLMMTAENAYDLLPTIRSRAVPFQFAPLSPEEMREFVERPRSGPAGAAHRAGRGQPRPGHFDRPGGLR